jgi:AmiR/NasT family two-component response regulator
MSPALKSLYIANEAEIRTLKKTAMKTGNQLNILGFTTVEEALSDSDTKADIIIIDITALQTPVQKILRLFNKNADLTGKPVVLITGDSNPHMVQNYYMKGVAGVLVKPIDTLILTREVLSLWTTYQMVNAGFPV